MALLEMSLFSTSANSFLLQPLEVVAGKYMYLQLLCPHQSRSTLVAMAVLSLYPQGVASQHK